MPVEPKHVDLESESDTSGASETQRFEQTVRRMLTTPPKAHDEMKMGATRKRGARSSGKGSGK